MYKYKKVISPILMIILTLSLIIITVALTFFHLTNISTLKTQLKNINYYNNVEMNITDNLKIYMADNDISSLLKNNRIKKDINKLIVSMKNNTLLQQRDTLIEEFKEDCGKFIYEQDKNSEEYINKISSVYFNNLFPISEVNILQNMVVKYTNLVITLLIISILCATLCIIYLIGAGKQTKWLFVSLYNSIIFCITFIIIIMSFKNIYYLNLIFTELIQSIIVTAIYDLAIICSIILVIVIILNYFKYFKKDNKIRRAS